MIFLDVLSRTLSIVRLSSADSSVRVESSTSSVRVGSWDELPVSVFSFLLPGSSDEYFIFAVPFVDSAFLRLWDVYARSHDFFARERPFRVSVESVSFDDFMSEQYMRYFAEDYLWAHRRVDCVEPVLIRPVNGYYVFRGCVS